MTVWKRLLLGSTLVLLAPVVLAARSGADVSLGTWKLDLAKSTFSSLTPPKSETRTYSAAPGGTHIVIDTEAADGKNNKTEVTIAYNGKVHPVTDNPDYDAASARRLSRYETVADLIRGGKVVGSLRRLVAQDGKTMSINLKLTKADGTTETAMSVYERQ